LNARRFLPPRPSLLGRRGGVCYGLPVGVNGLIRLSQRLPKWLLRASRGFDHAIYANRAFLYSHLSPYVNRERLSMARCTRPPLMSVLVVVVTRRRGSPMRLDGGLERTRNDAATSAVSMNVLIVGLSSLRLACVSAYTPILGPFNLKDFLWLTISRTLLTTLRARVRFMARNSHRNRPMFL